MQLLILSFPTLRLCASARDHFRWQRLSIVAAALILIASTVADAVAAEADGSPAIATTVGGVSTDTIAQAVARLIADAIPREYERYKDWGRTKRITTGVRSSGNFFEFDIHRRQTEVNHGVWKHYRVTLIEPDQHLAVRIDDLRSAGPGRVACTLLVAAKLHGWARTKVYNRGVHLIALEAECDTSLQLALEVEVAIETAPSSLLTGIAVRPQVTSARLKLDDFRLTRVSDLKGPVARELGDGLRHLIEDELDGPTLAAKLNRSIEKRRDRLQLTPERLFGLSE
jgi:hypothetical protein